ncbi:MAG: hypothetical protein EYC69_11325 [Bacteroidetes bacterium]|nr:MAG: hypothetical protein EYC69_11325 [Bacteroidota bacterium]
MKQLFKPISLLFYLLAIIVFFFLGAFFAGITDAAEGQGLAGGAIVFWYGLNFSFGALVLSLITVYHSSTKFIIKVNKILAIIFVLLFSVLIYLFFSKKNANAGISREILSFKNSNVNKEQLIDSLVGLGFFSPDFVNSNAFYFYGNPFTEKSSTGTSAIDSLVFIKSKQAGFEIYYAPAWFKPELVKMDYDILLIKILSMTKDFVEVIVNTSTGKTVFVKKSEGTIRFWPEFLLTIHSVEFLSETEHPVFVKPVDYAAEVNYKYEIMHPVMINDTWMQVELLDEEYKFLGKGWIRWREGEKLLIRYNLLS